MSESSLKSATLETLKWPVGPRSEHQVSYSSIMSSFNLLNFRKQSEEQVKALEVTDEFGVCLTELGKCQLAVISGALPDRISLSSSGHRGAARTPAAGGRHAEAVH